MDDFELQLKKDFLDEASQILESAEQAFLALESSPQNPDILNQIFRLAHNLKGTSRAVGFGNISEFTHVFENLILKIKEGQVFPNPAVVSLLLECNDQINKMIAGLKDDINKIFDNADLIRKLEDATAGKLADDAAAAPAMEAPAPEVHAQDMAEFAGPATSAAPAPVAEAEFVKASNHLEVELPVQPVSQAPAHAPAEAKKVNADESLRVSVGKLESLNNLVGELVILQSVLSQHKSEFKSPLATKSLSQLGKLSKEIHEMSMSLRMVPVKATLQKMQRIVRDTSKALGKEVHLNLVGEETEVDKTVLEFLNDPLVHIVRNAVDHGLETTEGRKAAGKSTAGVITINCFHEGNSLIIAISDDGKGIDPAIIRKKAIEKNVIRENAQMSDAEIIDLIFHPGFSTKEQVSEISGRGVGMDVVKTNIKNLNGNVYVESVVGKGSIFRISLPLTMAVIDGLVTRIGDEKYVFPLTQIHETMRIDSNAISTISGAGEVLNLRGKTIPLFRLNKTLQRTGQADASQGAIVVTRTRASEYGIMVDEIFHQQQIVVKNLGPEISKRKGFMGSSILGDGRPALIIDLHKLYEPNDRSAA